MSQVPENELELMSISKKKNFPIKQIEKKHGDTSFHLAKRQIFVTGQGQVIETEANKMAAIMQKTFSNSFSEHK